VRNQAFSLRCIQYCIKQVVNVVPTIMLVQTANVADNSNTVLHFAHIIEAEQLQMHRARILMTC